MDEFLIWINCIFEEKIVKYSELELIIDKLVSESIHNNKEEDIFYYMLNECMKNSGIWNEEYSLKDMFQILNEYTSKRENNYKLKYTINRLEIEENNGNSICSNIHCSDCIFHIEVSKYKNIHFCCSAINQIKVGEFKVLLMALLGLIEIIDDRKNIKNKMESAIMTEIKSIKLSELNAIMDKMSSDFIEIMNNKEDYKNDISADRMINNLIEYSALHGESKDLLSEMQNYYMLCCNISCDKCIFSDGNLCNINEEIEKTVSVKEMYVYLKTLIGEIEVIEDTKCEENIPEIKLPFIRLSELNIIKNKFNKNLIDIVDNVINKQGILKKHLCVKTMIGNLNMYIEKHNGLEDSLYTMHKKFSTFCYYIHCSDDKCIFDSPDDDCSIRYDENITVRELLIVLKVIIGEYHIDYDLKEVINITEEGIESIEEIDSKILEYQNKINELSIMKEIIEKGNYIGYDVKLIKKAIDK